MEPSPRRFAGDCRGATAIEYGVIATGIALAISGAVVVLGGNIGGVFGTVSSSVSSPATETAPPATGLQQVAAPERPSDRDRGRGNRIGPARVGTTQAQRLTP